MKYLFVLFIAGWSSLCAQPMNQADTETLISIAEDRVINQDYHNALTYYHRAYQNDKSWKIIMQLARMNHALRDYYAAADWYDRLIKEYPQEADVEVRLEYARLLKECDRHDQARGVLDWISGHTKDPSILQAISIESEGIRLLNTPVDEDVVVTTLSSDLNTPFSEGAPFIGSDYLAFSSWDKNKIYEYSDRPDDLTAKLFRVPFFESKQLLSREEVKSPVHKEKWHDTQYYESRDQRYRIWIRSKLVGNVLTKNEVFIQEEYDGEYGAPQLIKALSDNFLCQHVQIAKFEGRDVLFFVTRLNTGYGERDIYRADYLGEGGITLPVNIGGGINTPGDECSPFFQDGKLYFSSTGHPSIGGLDVYVSTWDGAVWSAPQHLARPINSAQDDWGYSSRNGESFLLSNRPEGDSFRGPTCCDDIYKLSYNGPLKQEELIVEKSPEVISSEPLLDEIKIVPLPEVKWQPGYTRLLKSAESSLDALAAQLKANPSWIVEIAAHTDSQGEPSRLVALSTERADIIKNYLIDNGVIADRLIAVGYGDRFIINKCKRGVDCTPPEHDINNRAEYSVVDYMNEPQEVKTELKPPTLSLVQDSIHLGTIKSGGGSSGKFVFTNTGDSELIIDLISACECTTLDWPQYEILPGEEAEINFKYDSKDKIGFQEVTVDIVANTKPILTEAKITINILPSE